MSHGCDLNTQTQNSSECEEGEERDRYKWSRLTGTDVLLITIASAESASQASV